MLVLYKTWIIPFLLIQAVLPLDCQQTIETKETSEEEDFKVRVGLKSMRRLLDTWQEHNEPTSRQKSTTSPDTGDLIYVFVTVFLALLGLLIKCCIHCANQQEENISGINIHPPPSRPSAAYPSRRFPTASMSRALAPPSTSRSLILLPNDREHQDLFMGIENPNYMPTGRNSCHPEYGSNNATPLLDMPPGYEDVIKKDSKYPIPTKTGDKSSKESESSSLPKYNF